MAHPDYHGGSIVNLMASLVVALGGEESLYAPLRALGPGGLGTRNVVLLVIDGLGYEYLRERRPQGALARHLKARMTSVFPSTTATAITTFLTGTAPQHHALTGWFMYFRELAQVAAILPYRTRQAGTPLALAPQALLEHVPVFDRIPVRSHVLAPADIAHSAFNTAHVGRARLQAYTTLAQMFAALARIARAPGQRQYVYAYWPTLDRLGHVHGMGSRETAAHLAEVDDAFEQFLARIAGSDTSVIVTADHGFVDATPERTVTLQNHPVLARTLVLPLCGEPRAAYCYVRAEARAAFVDYVNERLSAYAELHESRLLIDSGWFGLGEPHPRLAERVGDYTLVMKDNAIIEDWLPGEKRFAKIGVHGGTSTREMYVPLIVAQA